MAARDLSEKGAKLRALKILTDRDKTEKELRDKLSRDGYDDGAIDVAVKYVRDYGYIDDARYAESYASYRMNAKSRIQLAMELRRRGVDEGVIDSVFDRLYDGFDESDQIIRLIEKKLKGTYPECLQDIHDEKEKAALYRSLQAKGYSFESIRRVLLSIST